MERTIDCRNVRVLIRQDPDPMDPEEGDTPIFLVHVHRDLYRIPKKGLPFTDEDGLREFFQEIGAPENFDSPEWAVFPLASYIHGGVTLALDESPRARNFPDQQWDVSRCGWIFVKKDGEWGKEDDGTTDYEKYAEAHVEVWNRYLGGDVWGYVVEKPWNCEECGSHGTEELDSCWEFYDLDECLEEARASAESHGGTWPEEQP